MDDSQYWREELARIAKSVRPITSPSRWSPRLAGVIERDIIVGFFVLRRLIESHKLPSGFPQRMVNVFSVRATKNVTMINNHRLHENYDWDCEVQENVSVLYLCNQCIHARVTDLCRGKDRNWSDLLVASDFEKSNRIFRVPVRLILELFKYASLFYPHTVSMKYNARKGDYDEEAL
jgi:hypothetical protein